MSQILSQDGSSNMAVISVYSIAPQPMSVYVMMLMQYAVLYICSDFCWIHGL